MGMYDNLTCRYPLPLDGANGMTYQTKDLVCFLDEYEIREDGTLWHEEYEVEDKSDPNAEGWERLVGMLSRVNVRWEPVTDFTGEVTFYGFKDDARMSGWVEWSAYFVDGKLNQVHLVTHEPCQSDEPTQAPAAVRGRSDNPD